MALEMARISSEVWSMEVRVGAGVKVGGKAPKDGVDKA
jgi:hypothetical protein